MEANSVSTATDLTWSIGGSGMHATGPIFDAFEQVAEMNWYPGGYLGRHSIVGSVQHKGNGIVLDGHDLGPLLHHAPVNFVLHSLKSSRKTIYVASTVLADKKAVACVDQPKNTLMMTCGDPVASRAGTNESNAMHTVFVGMSELDYFKGHAAATATIVTDAVGSLLGALGPAESAAEIVDGLAPDIFGLDAKKAAIGSVVNLCASAAVSYKSGWKEPISYKAEIGGAYGGASVGWTYDPDKNRLVEHKVEVGLPIAKGSVATDWDKVTATGQHRWSDKPAEKTWGEAL